MEKIIVNVSVDLEVSANRDPRDLAQDILDMIVSHIYATPKDVRYTLRSGQPINDTGIMPPRKGSVDV